MNGEYDRLNNPGAPLEEFRATKFEELYNGFLLYLQEYEIEDLEFSDTRRDIWNAAWSVPEPCTRLADVFCRAEAGHDVNNDVPNPGGRVGTDKLKELAARKRQARARAAGR